jgi:hypothetical protein
MLLYLLCGKGEENQQTTMNELESDESKAKPLLLLKNWKKYTFEFLMLFLAVFMGFVTENIREDFAEKQQSIELAKSFYEELKSDSIAVASKVEGRIRKEQSIRYMVDFFRDSALTSSSKPLSVNFIWAMTARTPIIFTPRTVVFEQLKSSGSLRYFKNQELQKLIGDLSVAIDYIHVRQLFEETIFNTYIEPIMVNHMDFEFQFKLWEGDKVFERLTAYEHSNEYIPFHLTQIEKVDRQAIINVLGYYHTNGLKSTRLIPFQRYIEVNAATLKELRKEYNLQ